MSSADFNILRDIIRDAQYKMKEQTWHGLDHIAKKAENLWDRLEEIRKDLGPYELED